MKWFKAWREKLRIRKIEKLGGVFIDEIPIPTLRIDDFTKSDYYGLVDAHNKCPELWRFLRKAMNTVESNLMSLGIDPSSDRERLVLTIKLAVLDDIYGIARTAIKELSRIDLSQKQKKAFDTMNNLGTPERENDE